MDQRGRPFFTNEARGNRPTTTGPIAVVAPGRTTVAGSSLSPAGPRSIAFFDLDRTLIAGSSLIALAQVASREGLIPRRALAQGLAKNVAFARRGADDTTVHRLRQSVSSLVAGRAYADVATAAANAAVIVGSRVYSGARMLIEQHRRAGDRIVVVSASPQELVASVALAVGADLGIGTRSEVVDGRLTGHVEGAFCYGEGKLTRIEEELGGTSFGVSTAYADSGSDIPLLQTCARPVAINPDRRLLRAARTAGWPVLRLT